MDGPNAFGIYRIYRFSTRATFPPPCCKYCAVYNIHTHTQAGLCVQHLWTTGWTEMGLFQSLIEHQSRWTVLILHLNIFITCLSSIYIVYLLACSYQVYMNDFLLLSNGQRLEHTHRAEISQCPAATISKVSSSCSGERETFFFLNNILLSLSLSLDEWIEFHCF